MLYDKTNAKLQDVRLKQFDRHSTMFRYYHKFYVLTVPCRYMILRVHNDKITYTVYLGTF